MTLHALAAAGDVADAEFFDGARPYNVWMFIITVSRVTLGLVGIVFTIRLAWKAATAAEASRDAAETTRDRLESVGALVDISTLCAWCSTVIEMLDRGAHEVALVRTRDLCGGLAQLSVANKGRQLLTGPKWKKLIEDARSVEQRLRELATNPTGNDAIIDDCHGRLSGIFYALNLLTTEAREATGAT